MRVILVIGLVLILNGCVVVDGSVEIGKTFWGSSTRALEKARAQSLTKTYDKGYWDVVRATEEFCQKKYLIFKKDEVRGYMVIMGIHGSVNTTEVGVFFVELNDHQTRIEVSSLSTNAKRIVAKALFHELDINFGLIAPDPIELVETTEEQKNESPR